MQLATVNVYQNNQLIRTILIEDQVDIEEANFFEKFLQWLFGLFSNTNADVILYPIGK